MVHLSFGETKMEMASYCRDSSKSEESTPSSTLEPKQSERQWGRETEASHGGSEFLTRQWFFPIKPNIQVENPQLKQEELDAPNGTDEEEKAEKR